MTCFSFSFSFFFFLFSFSFISSMIVCMDEEDGMDSVGIDVWMIYFRVRKLISKAFF